MNNLPKALDDHIAELENQIQDRNNLIKSLRNDLEFVTDHWTDLQSTVRTIKLETQNK